jgi:uncharacterized protein YuzE
LAKLRVLSAREVCSILDPEADVLYIDFYSPPKSASDSEMTDNDIIIRYDNGDKIVGLTVLNVSKRS